MKRIVYIVLTLAALAFGLTFVLKNQATVELYYYFDLHWTGPIAVVLLVAMLIGLVCGALASLLMVLRVRRELARTRRQYKKMEQELMNLRSLPIKDVI